MAFSRAHALTEKGKAAALTSLGLSAAFLSCSRAFSTTCGGGKRDVLMAAELL